MCLKWSVCVYHFFYSVWDGVHQIDSFHELGGDSSWKEVNQDVLVGYSAESGIVFEFWYVFKEVEFFIDLGGG